MLDNFRPLHKFKTYSLKAFRLKHVFYEQSFSKYVIREVLLKISHKVKRPSGKLILI